MFECLNQKMLSLHKNGIIRNIIMEYKDDGAFMIITQIAGNDTDAVAR